MLLVITCACPVALDATVADRIIRGKYAVKYIVKLLYFHIPGTFG